ncbi:hypothetical protein DIZ76_011852 [Coccidioides immitis]|nr:hypothetical protein DIZ76_011852 [Coccidioides immitis]
MGIRGVPISASPLAALTYIRPTRGSPGILGIADFGLEVIQNPVCAFIGEDGEPVLLQRFPIVKFKNPLKLVYPQDGHLFVHCTLHLPDGTGPLTDHMSGTTIVPFQRLKGLDDVRDSYFIFSNLSFNVPGRYKLKYTLLEVAEGRVSHFAEEESAVFPVYGQNTARILPLPTPLQLKLVEDDEYRTFFPHNDTEEAYTSPPGLYRANSVVLLDAPIAHILNGWKIIPRVERFDVHGNRQVWVALEPGTEQNIEAMRNP